MRYRSKPTECEAMQWAKGCTCVFDGDTADAIVAWVNANGGEARYVGEDAPSYDEAGPRIAVRTINGWAYAAPGHYVVMGSATFDAARPEQVDAWMVRDFYPCDPETFEQRWEQVA